MLFPDTAVASWLYVMYKADLRQSLVDIPLQSANVTAAQATGFCPYNSTYYICFGASSGQVTGTFHSNSLRMENLDTKTLKENNKASTGITFKQNGHTIETYSSKGKLIHIIDQKEVQQKIAIHRWIGTVSNDEIKEVSDGHFIQFVITNGCTKIIVDTSQLNGFFDGVNDWLAEYFIPKMIKNGVKHNAFLVSEEFYADLAIEESDDEFPNILTTRIFGAEDKALKWLKSVKQ